MVKVHYWEKNPVCALNISKDSAASFPLHMKVPSPGRAAYLPHIPRPCKHNVFKFWLCLFVWLFFSYGDDGALHHNYLLLLLISHFSKQSLALPLEMNLIPAAAEAGELWRGRGSLCNPCKQCSAGQEALACDSTGNAAHTGGDLCFLTSTSLCPRKGMCCPDQIFKDNKVLTTAPQGILYFKHGHPNMDIGLF